MRTTVTIDDRLLELAKQRAHAQHTTLGAVVTEALQRLILARTPQEGPPLPVFTGGTGLLPGIDATSNRSFAEAMEDYPDPAATAGDADPRSA